jgi:coenzyme F420-reducing hydrogenase alpha subunit
VTHRAGSSRTVRVDALARVEGEGGLYVEIVDGQLRHVQLRIYEPPRFFEAFLRGRAYSEPPDITARICGICPVAYQMSACNAIESLCGVTVDGPLADLRRLIYCGEWIESHALHIYLLHAPDFLCYESAIEMADGNREVVQQGLELKKAGNQLVALIGGRPIHPVNVRLGGFHRVPTERELRGFAPRLERARDLALDTVQWVASFPVPDFDHHGELVALRAPGEYPITRGRLISTAGLDIHAGEFDRHVVEEQVSHSNALHAHLLERGEYLVGPMARFALNFRELTPITRAAADEAGIGPDERNPFRSIVIRALEVLYACDEALAIIERYREPDLPWLPVEPRAGVGYGWTEAPRGVLWHRYELDSAGTILDARIVPPTAQNQPSIEHDLFHFVAAHLDLPDDELRWRAEQVIRNYDPCISCATHFLDLTVERT